MGGIGSGTWYRWDKQTTIEEIKRIDIRFLRKHGWLINLPGSYKTGTLSWKSGGEPSGFINITSRHDKIALDYRFREGGGEWEPVKQTIFFDRTPCNYGGHRKWFLCPLCHKRVGILCGVHKLFLCRHCYKIPYSSQNEGDLNRLISKKHKLGKQIFEDYDGNGWLKKKGIHQKTFDRLLQNYINFEEQIDLSTYGRYMELQNQGITYR